MPLESTGSGEAGDERRTARYKCALCGQEKTPEAWYQHGDVAYCSNCARVHPLSDRLWIKSEDRGWEAPPDSRQVTALTSEPVKNGEATKVLAFVGCFALVMLSVVLMLDGGQVGFVFGGMLAFGVVLLLLKTRIW